MNCEAWTVPHYRVSLALSRDVLRISRAKSIASSFPRSLIRREYTQTLIYNHSEQIAIAGKYRSKTFSSTNNPSLSSNDESPTKCRRHHRGHTFAYYFQRTRSKDSFQLDREQYLSENSTTSHGFRVVNEEQTGIELKMTFDPRQSADSCGCPRTSGSCSADRFDSRVSRRPRPMKTNFRPIDRPVGNRPGVGRGGGL